MIKKLALASICFASLCGTAAAHDAKAVIAAAQKALGDPTSITYSGFAKDVAFQQWSERRGDGVSGHARVHRRSEEADSR